MTDSRAAVGFDRLPWLADEPERPAGGLRRDLAGWAVAATLLIAGASYWLGQRSATDFTPMPATHTTPRSTTVPLPAPAPAQPQVQPERIPQVESAPVPTIAVPRANAERYVAHKRTVVRPQAKTGEAPSELEKELASEKAATSELLPAPKVTAPVAEKPLKLWPSRVSQGASGRLVQIGAFGSRQQAKVGWTYMARAYPGVKRLPAVVVEARNSHGRHFYRFQIGTTSQAHSEVLCQRMERIHFSCAVVGLPGERKAVER